ncbi:MAG: phosphatase PAP2 family protein [Burkholderiaceae bacterium]|jgi:undecaprenyl-diphosphatase|nr:phosphatase PAP2 family protein [Burkholderiaceae bacterium]
MLFFDPALFALFNADAQTPAASVAVARAISSWLPTLCAAPLLLGLWRGSPALRRTLVLAMCSMLAAWAVARLIRWGFPSPRPMELGLGMQWVDHALRSSFPSMHATGAFALAQALTLGCTRHRRWVMASAWGLALAMAWSRVHLGVHLPSDVIGGAIVGICSATLVWRGALWLRRTGMPWLAMRSA